MSDFDQRKSAPPAWHPAHNKLVLEILAHNRRVAEIMATVARLHGGADLEAAKQKFWARGTEAFIVLPGQASDTALTNVVITKRGDVIKLKLEAGDVEAAERLAKKTGKSYAECLKIYSDLNIRNTPSYMGGELIEKGASVTPKERRKQEKKTAEFIANYRMTGTGDAVEKAVFSAIYGLRQPIGQRPGQPVRSALELLTGRR
jgi:hypothetical protein